jgi:hypothetical protein
MTVGNKKEPALPDRSTGILWREIARSTCLDVDWRPIAKSALGSAFLAGLVGGALHVLGKAIEAEMRADAKAARNAGVAGIAPEPTEGGQEASGSTVPPEAEAPSDEADASGEMECVDAVSAEAASLLGVDASASEDEIRAALRSHLASSRLHPDHGGEGEEAKRLIAAKNLLIERARARR